MKIEQEIMEMFERRKKRQGYMETQGCLSCGHKADHSKARVDSNGNSYLYTHQFENPNAEDLMSDKDFISRIITLVQKREREEMVEKLIEIEEWKRRGDMHPMWNKAKTNTIQELESWDKGDNLIKTK